MDESSCAPLTAKFGSISAERNQAIKHPTFYPPPGAAWVHELTAFARTTYRSDCIDIASTCSSGEPIRVIKLLIAHAVDEKFRTGSSHCTFTTRATQADLKPKRGLFHRATRDITAINYAGNNDTFVYSTDIPVTRSHMHVVTAGTIDPQHINDNLQGIAAAAYAHPL